MMRYPYKRDQMDTAPLFRCWICQGEIYLNERYYQTDEGAFCYGCLIWYARQKFLPQLRIAGETVPEAEE